VDRDPNIAGDRFRQGRTRLANKIDLDGIGRERTSVILHAGTSPEVTYDNDGGTHLRQRGTLG
jgi:hypothetical protein